LEWCKHFDEPVVSIREREGAESVEDAGSVRDGGEQPFKIVLVNALWEKRNNFKKHSGIGAKFSEQWGDNIRKNLIGDFSGDGS